MREDYTHISLILDRSGSMEAIRDDTIGGFNTFLQDQKEQPGHATITLVQFDTEDSYEVIHHFQPIAEVPKLTGRTYVPRGGTPLLDTLGRGINDLQKCIADMEEEERPSKIIFAIITDGRENSSKEFRKGQIIKMIQDRTAKDDWHFAFLSADLDAVRDAISYGIPPRSTRRFDKSGEGSNQAWSSLSGSMSSIRSGDMDGIQFDAMDTQVGGGTDIAGGGTEEGDEDEEDDFDIEI